MPMIAANPRTAKAILKNSCRSAFFLAAISDLLGLPLLEYLKGFAFIILYLMFANITCFYNFL
jgi:hypothetical protein